MCKLLRRNRIRSRLIGFRSKAQILAAVREALGDEAAERIADKKKQEMAEKAEQLLAGTGWLPPVLRTERPAWLTDEQPEDSAAETESVEPFTVTAE